MSHCGQSLEDKRADVLLDQLAPGWVDRLGESATIDAVLNGIFDHTSDHYARRRARQHTPEYRAKDAARHRAYRAKADGATLAMK